MNTQQSLRTLAFVVITLALAPQGFAAQGLPPGSIEMFNALDPAQKRILLDQYGLDENILDTQVRAERVQAPALGMPVTQLEQVKREETEAKSEAETGTETKTREIDGLEPVLSRFGEDIFDKEVSTFAPSDNNPVPQGYVLGPGDTLNLVLYGNDTLQTQLTVDREGSVNFPLLGPIAVAGMTWTQAREYIDSLVAEQLIGTKVVISVGRLKSINVFMAGEVAVPGTYSISALATVIQSVYVAGGVSPIGSYRDIRVNRGGRTVAVLDLYDLLLKGSLKGDIRLQSGDVVFVPRALPLVGIQGEVRKPGIYEVKPDETLRDVLEMAGRATSAAYLENALFERREITSSIRQLLDIDLRDDEQLNQALIDGDRLTILKVADEMSNPLTILGAVERPGLYAWSEGVRISSFIGGVDGYLKKDADRDIALIIRRKNERLDVEVLSFSPLRAIAGVGSEDDPVLFAHDEVLFFDRNQSRQDALAPLMSKLKKQASPGIVPNVVTIKGLRRGSGSYPLEAARGLRELVVLAGGASAFDEDVDLRTGLIVTQDGDRKVSVGAFNLGEVSNSEFESDEDLTLTAGAEVYIFNRVESERSNRQALMTEIIAKLDSQANDKDGPEVIRIEGRVRVPGIYPLIKNQDVRSHLDLAGGYLEGAYTIKAEVVRSIVSAEQESDTEIIQINLSDEVALKRVKLLPRDIIRINTIPGWSEGEYITLRGEVRFPGIYALEKGESLSSVLARAGGLTQRAFPAGAIYVNKNAAVKQLAEARRMLKIKFDSRAEDVTMPADIGEDALNSVIAPGGGAELDLDLEEEWLGRITVNLKAIIEGNVSADLVVQDGDSLTVPVLVNYVSVVGEVFNPGNFSLPATGDVDSLVELAGGVTRFSDAKRTFVIKADGSVVRSKRNRWLMKGSGEDGLSAGDTIVVPTNPDYERPLKYWQSLSSVIFQSLASIAAFFSIADK